MPRRFFLWSFMAVGEPSYRSISTTCWIAVKSGPQWKAVRDEIDTLVSLSLLQLSPQLLRFGFASTPPVLYLMPPGSLLPLV